jgi:hypothetical protein
VQETAGGVEKDGEQVEGRTLGAVVLDSQLALTELGGLVVNVAEGDRILVLADGCLLR